MSNIVTATFYGTATMVTTTPKYQWDRGQLLNIVGLELPEVYKVDFSNYESKESAVSSLNSEDGVSIPDELFDTGLPIYAFVVVPDDDSTTTEYKIIIPVIKRPEPTDIEPTPEQQSLIDELIIRLNTAVDICETAAAQIESLDTRISANSEAISELNNTLFGSIAEGETLNLRRAR